MAKLNELEPVNYKANVSHCQMFDDIPFMESFAGGNIHLDKLIPKQGAMKKL